MKVYTDHGITVDVAMGAHAVIQQYGGKKFREREVRLHCRKCGWVDKTYLHNAYTLSAAHVTRHVLGMREDI